MKYTVFYRWSDEMNVIFFEASSELEDWLSQHSFEEGGGLGLSDFMAGNGLRESSLKDVADLAGKRGFSLPENTFLVIKGAPIKLVVQKRVTRFVVPI